MQMSAKSRLLQIHAGGRERQVYENGRGTEKIITPVKCNAVFGGNVHLAAVSADDPLTVTAWRAKRHISPAAVNEPKKGAFDTRPLVLSEVGSIRRGPLHR